MSGMTKNRKSLILKAFFIAVLVYFGVESGQRLMVQGLAPKIALFTYLYRSVLVAGAIGDPFFCCYRFIYRTIARHFY